MYKTAMTTWVPVELAGKLDKMARARGVSLSSLLAGVLASFAGVELPKAIKDTDAEALTIIRKYPGDSCRALSERLKAAGIKRGHSWVWEKRLPMRAKASTTV
jgi:hypothetical protein